MLISKLKWDLQAVTDGEFRRTWWHLDFIEHLNGIEGYVTEKGYNFEVLKQKNMTSGISEKFHSIQIIHLLKILLNLRKLLVIALSKTNNPKSKPIFETGIRNLEIYPDIEDYANDIIKHTKMQLKHFMMRVALFTIG